MHVEFFFLNTCLLRPVKELVWSYRAILQCRYQAGEVGLDTRQIELEHIKLVAVDVEGNQ